MVVFLAVGITAVSIDAFVYSFLITTPLNINFSKGLSALCGASFAYVANRRVTFRSDHSTRAMVRFFILYITSFSANIAVNALSLRLLQGFRFQIAPAFVAATATSTVMNFVGMKLWVFRRRS
jgi:putative flippase GtrA